MHGNISPTMFTGSMVGSGAMAFALMSYCIANARPDENDCLDLNPPVLAAVFGESVEIIETAISFLCSEDQKSRSLDEGGKRIILVGPGPFRYRVVNLAKYRSDQDREYRTEYWRQHKQWQRDGRKGVFKFDALSTDASTPCPQVSKPVHPAGTGTGTGTGTDKKEKVDVAPEVVLIEFPKNLNTARVMNKWEAWMTHRRAFKKPKSWVGMFNEQIEWLSKFDEPKVIEILSASIRNGWQGLFEPKSKNGYPGSQTSQRSFNQNGNL